MAIYFDMDEVLFSFTQGACNLYGIDYNLFQEQRKTGTYLAAQNLASTPEAFKSRIDNAGTAFWRNLPMYPWTFSLFQKIDEYGITILTTPFFGSNNSRIGKLQSIQQVCDLMCIKFPSVCFADDKGKLSSPDDLLLDDKMVGNWQGELLQFPTRLIHNHGSPELTDEGIFNFIFKTVYPKLKEYKE